MCGDMSNSEINTTRSTAIDCVNLANNLIVLWDLALPLVNHVAEIKSKLFQLLYEKITGLAVLNVQACRSRSEEARKIQAVIDALSLDVLQMSLTHITGEAIVDGDVFATYNLLHIFEGVLSQSCSKENKQIPIKRKTCKLTKCKNLEECSNHQTPLSMLKRNQHQYRLKPPKKTNFFPPCHKSYLLPSALRKKSGAHLKNIPATKIRSDHRFLEEDKMCESTNDNFIQELLSEFPFIQVSPSLMRHIESTYERQLRRMHNLMKTCLLEENKAFKEVEETLKRQIKLSNLIRKDALHKQFLEKVKDERENERKIKYCIRDSRLKSAKMRQYSNEFMEDLRKKLSKPNTKEELIFEQVFKEVMKIQNEAVDDLCQQVKDSRTNDAEEYLNHLISLENLYRTQYSMLFENIAHERHNALVRMNAEKRFLIQTQREFRDALKREIDFMKGVIVEHSEDCHFREMDAAAYIERKRKELTR